VLHIQDVAVYISPKNRRYVMYGCPLRGLIV
jgi:hypothetical protein